MTSLPFSVRFAAFFFSDTRDEYYEYLSMIIKNSNGAKNIKHIFYDDIDRYGKSPRGILSQHWAKVSEETGDLGQCFDRTLPASDVNFIRSLQEAGGGILDTGLQDLADLTRVNQKLSGILKKLYFVIGFSLLLVVGMLFAIGYYLAPEIQSSFTAIDPVYYKSMSRLFFGIGDAMKENGLFYLFIFLALASCFPYVLSNLTGSIRTTLDKYGIFALYRKTHSIRFMLSLSTLIKSRVGAESISLDSAVYMLMKNESRWMKWHLGRMLEKMEGAMIGAETFDTGLFDKEVIWYMSDMQAITNLGDAIQLSKSRLEEHTIKDLSTKSMILSWIILLSTVLSMLSIYFLVMVVISEMTSLMKLGIF